MTNLAAIDPHSRFPEVVGFHEDAQRAIAHSYDPKSDCAWVVSVVAAKTPEEVATERARKLAELDLMCGFQLLATIEAILRMDAQERLNRDDGDPVGQYLRENCRNPSRLLLEDEILRSWKSFNPEVARCVEKLESAFKYRHWVAHGMYWTARTGLNKRHEFDQIRDLVPEVLKFTMEASPESGGACPGNT